MSTSITSNLGIFKDFSDTDQTALKKVQTEYKTSSVILVHIAQQRLFWVQEGDVKCSYPVSTAKKGVGQVEGSNQTPLGFHIIASKIGEKADPYAIFNTRVLTGKVAVPTKDGKEIVGRILWLKGLEQSWNVGKNKEGQSVDSYSRYIYIHGTTDIDNIGKPASKGCIRMKPEHVVNLFDEVKPNTLVYIYS